MPAFFWPDVPLTLETLRIILPYSIGFAVVGLLESLMIAQIVDDMTDTPSAKNRESTGQGIANILAGLFGGMAGCAMIGESVINVKSGGRGRLTIFVAGVFLLILIVVFGNWVRQIPMPALVAVMIMVSIGTFSWASFKNLSVHPKSSSIVMLATVIVVLFTHNLALGVGEAASYSAPCSSRGRSPRLSVSPVNWTPPRNAAPTRSPVRSSLPRRKPSSPGSISRKCSPRCASMSTTPKSGISPALVRWTRSCLSSAAKVRKSNSSA